jgi:SAM-dependent methyltransferase
MVMNVVDIAYKIRKNGIIGSARKLHGRLLPQRARGFLKHLPRFDGLRGIEIGGPTLWAFGPRGLIPVYPRAGGLDNVNFAATTVWEGSIHTGRTYRFDPHKRPGLQYVAEAADLSLIPTNTYDFLLSSHTLEHTANPIKAVLEWIRIVRPGGLLLIVLPDKEHTFDHYRPVTLMEHMIDDFQALRGEDDLTHLDESVRLHDYSMTPEIPDAAAFKARSLENLRNRCLHHHTFTQKSASELIEYLRLDVIEQGAVRPHICMLVSAQKLGDTFHSVT